MSRSAHLKLARLSYDSESPGRMDLLIFDFDVQTRKEDGLVITVFEPLAGIVEASGKSPEEALDEFVDCFKTVVDFHFEKGSWEKFFSFHLEGLGLVKFVTLTYEPDEGEELRAVFPHWQTPQHQAA